MRLPLLLLFLMAMMTPAHAEPLPPLGGSLRAPDLWMAYKAAFVSDGGRVVDNANGNVSHSEGQGYGMLLAVAADDRETFDKMWDWTRSQLMLRDDGLAAWRWAPDASPHVSDRNNATDGDLLIAWALAEAGERWSVPAFKTASLALARALTATVVADSPFGPILMPGATGFGRKDRPDGPVVNPSYWVFPALNRLATLQPELSWKTILHSGMELLAATRMGPSGLPPDWVSLGAEEPEPAKGYPATFGYDAIRVPLYVAWANAGRKRLLTPFAAVWADAGAPPRRIDIESGTPGEEMGDSGYRAIAALVRCAKDGIKLPPETMQVTVDRYYPTTLRLLVLTAARQRYPQCL